MSDFLDSADKFYAKRDDRTNRCSSNRAYQNASCSIHISQSAAQTSTGQAMLFAATNLMSRWCRRFSIVVPTIQAHPFFGPAASYLGDQILSQMHNADPFGIFQVGKDNNCQSEITLWIGADSRSATGAQNVYIDASGWLASISTNAPIPLPKANDNNVLGAVAAACFGIAQLFKVSLGMDASLLLREGVFDLFSLRWCDEYLQALWPEDLNIGNALMVGAGSVASAAAYCMRLGGLAGAMTIIDKDDVKIENFNRSPVFGLNSLGLKKSAAVAVFLAGSKLNATTVPFWWSDFIKQRMRSTFDFDLWLPLANEFDVRRSIQHSVPPLMIHASTTSNWGVNHARHVPGHDDCLADRFPSEVSISDLTCSTGQVETPQEKVMDAALPFASLFAGALITADMVRALLPNYPQVPNFALFDFYGPLEHIQCWDRKPRSTCMCQEQGSSFHEQFNGRTKFRDLFF